MMSANMSTHPLLWGGASLLLLACPLAGQFSGLAATDDGAHLYFTSQMLLRGVTAQSDFPEARLYHFGPGGVTLFAERGRLAPDGSGSTNDGVRTPTVSGDGTLVAFTFNDVCLTTPDCVSPVSEAELRGSQTLDLGPGRVQLSRNGKWALVANEIYPDNYNPPFVIQTYTTTLIDLTSGQRTLVSSAPVPGSLATESLRTLASDGSVLISTGFRSDLADPAGLGFAIWKQGKVTPLLLPPGISPIALTDDAGAIVYAGSSPENGGVFQVAVFQLAAAKSTVVFQGKDPRELPFFMSAANTGRRILYRVAADSANGAAFVWDASTGASTPLSLDPGELATDGTLTGAGDYAFVATTHFRIVKFPLASATSTTLFPPPPYCDDPGALGGGSLVRLHCSFTASMAGLKDHVLYDRQPMPLLAAEASGIAVQIPWQWDNFVPPTLTIDIPGDSPFQSSQPLSVSDGAPAIVPVDAGQTALFGIKIVKGDWSGLVTAPPAPGDVVHIYMTGLGWPQSPETTGVRASLTVPNPLQWELSCRFLPQAQSAQTLFAGIAPGMLGVYQTTFRIPADSVNAPITGLTCTLAAPSYTVTFGPGTPAIGIYGGGFGVSPGVKRSLQRHAGR
jgi:uncharacterized protein (TIGR03437 family)